MESNLKEQYLRVVSEELSRRTAQLILLNRAGCELATIFDFDELLRRTVKLLAETFNYYSARLFMVEPEAQEIVLRAGAGRKKIEKECRFKINHRGICSWVARRGEPLLINDGSQEPDFTPQSLDIKSELAVPIKLKGQVIGVLDVQSERVNAFDEIDLFTLVTLADQLAVYIENARLYREFQQELSERRRMEKALNLQKAYFQQLFENSPEGIVILDNADRVVEANKGFKKLFQYSIEEIKGRPLNEIIVPEDLAEEASALSQAVLNGEVVQKESVRRRKDGSLVEVSILGYPIEFANKQIGIYAIYNDITERKQMERKLRESEEKYRTLVRELNVGVFRRAPELEGGFMEANPALIQIHGYESEEEFLKASPWDLYQNPEDRREFYEELMRNDFVKAKELRLKKKDGTPIWASVTARLIRDEKGEPRYYEGVVEDITERKKAEEEREKLLRELDRKVNELSCLHELAESIRKRNTLPEIFQDVAQLLEHAWGHPEITRARVTFDNEQYVTRPFEPTKWRQSADILVRGEKRGEIEVFYLEPRSEKNKELFTGKELSLLDSIANTLGEAIERREAEVEKARASAMAAALREADRIKTNFMSIASHELRTPMTVLVGFTELLLNRDLPEEKQRDWLERIYRESKRLATIVDDLLNVSRIQSGQITVEQQKLKLLEVVREAVQLVSGVSEKHSLALDIPEDLPLVLGDRDKLTQVLINLLDNAIKYSPQGGKITVAARQETERVVVSVSDQGIGIAPEDRERIFTTFTRIRRPEAGGVRGTGLGLYIVKALVELMGGEIWVESELDKGSTFFFSLPLFKERRRKNEEKGNAGRR